LSRFVLVNKDRARLCGYENVRSKIFNVWQCTANVHSIIYIRHGTDTNTAEMKVHRY